MKITSVTIHKRNDDSKMKGMASVVLDDCFVIRNIRILEKEDGFLVAMPSIKSANGTYHDAAHPINQETRKMFEDAILEAYNNAEEEE